MTTRTANRTRTPKPWTPTADEWTRLGNVEASQAALGSRLDGLEERLHKHDREIDALLARVAAIEAKRRGEA